MRVCLLVVVFLVVACADQEPHRTAVDVDESAVPALISALEALTDSGIDPRQLTQLARTTPVDQEQQVLLPVVFRGERTELLYHVWREQPGWVHVYFSADSAALIEAITTAAEPLARIDPATG